MRRYTDRRCDDLQREQDILHRELRDRHRLLDEEMDRRVRALAERQTADMASSKEQTTQAREAMEHRLEGMNEFREQLREQSAKFLTREVLDGIVAGLEQQDSQQEARLRRLEERVTADEGGSAASSKLKEARRSSLTLFSVVVTALLFGVSVVLSIVLVTHG